MNEAWNFDRCVSVLTAEIALLKEIAALQNEVRQLVISREWSDFEEKTREINRLGEEFARLEDERTQLFFALNSAHEDIKYKHFYAAILNLPAEEGRELSNLYRELKMETLKMRALNETFLVYLGEAKAMAAAYIEAVCPARGGKLYTRGGRRVSQDLKSIVINNRF